MQPLKTYRVELKMVREYTAVVVVCARSEEHAMIRAEYEPHIYWNPDQDGERITVRVAKEVDYDKELALDAAARTGETPLPEHVRCVPGMGE